MYKYVFKKRKEKKIKEKINFLLSVLRNLLPYCAQLQTAPFFSLLPSHCIHVDFDTLALFVRRLKGHCSCVLRRGQSATCVYACVCVCVCVIWDMG